MIRLRVVGEKVVPILIPVAGRTLVRIGTAALIASYALSAGPAGSDGQLSLAKGARAGFDDAVRDR